MSRNSQIYTIAGILAVLTVCVVIITVMVAGCGKKNEPVSVSPDPDISVSDSEDDSSEEPSESEEESSKEESSKEESSHTSSSAPIYYPPDSKPSSGGVTGTGTATGSGSGSSSSSASSAVLSKAGTVRNKTYSTLTIKPAVEDGNVRLENVKLTKKLVINGSDRVELVNCTIPEIVVDSSEDTVDLIAKGKTEVNSVVIYTHANLWEEDLKDGYDGFKKVSTKTGRGYVRLKVGLYDTDLDSFKAGELTELSENNSSVKSYLSSSNLVDSSSSGSGSSSGSSSSKDRYMNLDVDDVSIDEGEPYEIDVYVTKESNDDDLSGVRVTGEIRSGSTYVRFVDSTGTTNRDGHAVLKIEGRERGAGDASIRIKASKSGYTTEQKTIDVTVGKMTLQERLDEAANASSSSKKTVALTSSLSVSGLTVPSGVTLEIANGKTLTISGALTNNGTITVKSGGTLSCNSGSAFSNNGKVGNSGELRIGGKLVNSGAITGSAVTGSNNSATLISSNASLPGTFLVNGVGETLQVNKTYTWNGSAWNRTDTPETKATAATLEELKNALNNDNIKQIEITGYITLDSSVPVLKKEITITQKNCGLEVPSNMTLTIEGTVNGPVMGRDSTSKLIVNGTLTGSNLETALETGKTYYWNSDRWSKVVDAGAVTSEAELKSALAQSDTVTVTQSFDAATLSVASGKTVTIASGKAITVSGNAAIDGTVNGEVKGLAQNANARSGGATLVVNGTLTGTKVYCNNAEETIRKGVPYTWDGSKWNRTEKVEPTAEEKLGAALQTSGAATTEAVTLTKPLTVPANRTLTVAHPITGAEIKGESGAKIVDSTGGALAGTTVYCNGQAETSVKKDTPYTWDGSKWNRIEKITETTVSSQQDLDAAIQNADIVKITINGALSIGACHKEIYLAGGSLTVTGSLTSFTAGEGASLTLKNGAAVSNVSFYAEGIGEEAARMDTPYTFIGGRWVRATTAQERLQSKLDGSEPAITTAEAVEGNLRVPANKTLTLAHPVSGNIAGENGSKLTITTGSFAGKVYNSLGSAVTVEKITYTWQNSRWERPATAEETLLHDLAANSGATVGAITLTKELTVPAGKTLTVTGAVAGTVKGAETAKLVLQEGGSVSGCTFYYKDGTTVKKDSLADTYTWTDGKWAGTAEKPVQSAQEAEPPKTEAGSRPETDKQVLPPSNRDNQPGPGMP